MRDIHPQYKNEVIISAIEWEAILYDLRELDQLRKLNDVLSMYISRKLIDGNS